MKKPTMALFIIAIVVAAGSLMCTVWADGSAESQPRGQRSKLASWLNLSETQQQSIKKADPTFEADILALQSEIKTRREALADVLENADATDDEVMNQIEIVIRSNEDIERRAAIYILKIRQFLDPQQRRKLMGLCATGVRKGGQGKGPHWRGGHDEQDGRGGGGGRGRGGGGGHGGPQSQGSNDDSHVNSAGLLSAVENVAHSNLDCPNSNAKTEGTTTGKAICPTHKNTEDKE